MKNVRIIAAIAVAGLLASCGGGSSRTHTDASTSLSMTEGTTSSGVANGTTDGETSPSVMLSEAEASTPPHKLNIPQPPTMVTGEAERLDFLATHYWDNFDYADLTWIADTTALESAFYAWTELLQRLPQRRAPELTGSFIRRAVEREAPTAVLLRLASVAEHYFRHPNSPFRNEELYIPVLRAVIAAPQLDGMHKIRPQSQLKTALKNRPGAVASDFAYTTADGTTHRLHQSTKTACNYTLLFFYNPDCQDCRRTKQFITASPVLSPLIASGSLHVVAIYPDENIDEWRAHLPEMPQGWTVGYDKEQAVVHRSLYDLSAIPCLYLLDKQQRVVLKDARPEEVEHFIKQ